MLSAARCRCAASSIAPLCRHRAALRPHAFPAISRSSSVRTTGGDMRTIVADIAAERPSSSDGVSTTVYRRFGEKLRSTLVPLCALSIDVPAVLRFDTQWLRPRGYGASARFATMPSSSSLSDHPEQASALFFYVLDVADPLPTCERLFSTALYDRAAYANERRRQ